MQTTSTILAVDWLQLVIAAGVTLSLTSVVALIIRRPLFGVLQLVCGSDVGARFWTTFAAVLLVMGPLFLVFTAAGGALNLADFVRRAVYLVSFGVIGAFMVMGAAVMLSAPSRALAERRAAEIGNRPAAPTAHAAPAAPAVGAPASVQAGNASVSSASASSVWE